MKKDELPYDGPTGITCHYLYDAFGRTLAVAKAPFGAGQANAAVEAYEYRDTATPLAVISYRFSVPKTYSTASPIPSGDDVAKSIAYRDDPGGSFRSGSASAAEAPRTPLPG